MALREWRSIGQSKDDNSSRFWKGSFGQQSECHWAEHGDAAITIRTAALHLGPVLASPSRDAARASLVARIGPRHSGQNDEGALTFQRLADAWRDGYDMRQTWLFFQKERSTSPDSQQI